MKTSQKGNVTTMEGKERQKRRKEGSIGKKKASPKITIMERRRMDEKRKEDHLSGQVGP